MNEFFVYSKYGYTDLSAPILTTTYSKFQAIFQFQYPRVWHHRQSWECDFFSVSRPTVHFVFDHIAFITDLLGKT